MGETGKGRPRNETNGCLAAFSRVKTSGQKRFLFDSLFVRYNAGMSVTRRQKEVLDFISNFVQRTGYSPSFEEIARGLSLKSLATVHKHITNLQAKGLLQRAHNRSRSIDVLPPRSRCAEIPCATSTLWMGIMCWWSTPTPLVKGKLWWPWCAGVRRL